MGYNVSTLPSIARSSWNFSISSSEPNSFRYFRTLRVITTSQIRASFGNKPALFQVPRKKTQTRSLTGCRRSLCSICPWPNQPLNDVQIPCRCCAVVAGWLIFAFHCLQNLHICSSWFGLVPLVSSRIISILTRECHLGPFWGVQMPAQSRAIEWFWERGKTIYTFGILRWNCVKWLEFHLWLNTWSQLPQGNQQFEQFLKFVFPKWACQISSAN